MRIANKALIFSVLAFVFLAGGVAWANGGFGIRPVGPNSLGHLSYTLKPGESLTDAVLVSNGGESPITLKIYVVDAHTAANGGTTFPAGEDASNTGAGFTASLRCCTVGSTSAPTAGPLSRPPSS